VNHDLSHRIGNRVDFEAAEVSACRRGGSHYHQRRPGHEFYLRPLTSRDGIDPHFSRPPIREHENIFVSVIS